MCQKSVGYSKIELEQMTRDRLIQIMLKNEHEIDFKKMTKEEIVDVLYNGKFSIVCTLQRRDI